MTDVTARIRDALGWPAFTPSGTRSKTALRLIGSARKVGMIAQKAKDHRFTLALPGLAGMTLISIGAGLRLGAWAGLVVAGIFALRIDGRL